LILSTGASTAEEIRAAFGELSRLGVSNRLVLLHCVSCYPTPIESLNLSAIPALVREFHVPCGLSDHTTSVSTGGWATAAGAVMIEKHFTLDPRMAGPDHAMSLPPGQLADYISNIREAQSARGRGTLGMTDLEAEVRCVAGRSVFTTIDLAAGTTLTPAMLTLKRPSGGIGPAQLDGLIGRRTSRRIPAETMLTWDVLA